MRFVSLGDLFGGKYQYQQRYQSSSGWTRLYNGLLCPCDQLLGDTRQPVPGQPELR
jgi:hypothetical protein